MRPIMRCPPRSPLCLVSFLLGATCWGIPLTGHDHSAAQAEKQQQNARDRALSLAESPAALAELPTCRLRLRLQESGTGRPLAATIRVTHLTSGKAIPLPTQIHRDLQWYSVPADVELAVPRSRLRIEAIHGLETECSVVELDLRERVTHSIDLPLQRIEDPRARRQRSGNTHLHLMKMSYLEALNYLQRVPQADGLDLVFLSHLRRIPDEKDYVSNQIVENSFAGGDLQRLAQHGIVFGNGQEHRHNFGRGGEGFGHVMLLNLQKLIHPVSIGPGIMAEGTDGRPLRAGIEAARKDGATAIWCHNTFGYEDLPNWAAGRLHAQNIFDGGDHGSYRDTYYRYLNLGWRVPFSTGTDWFLYDFSRVYVPVADELTVPAWLAALQAGKSFITNGPLLEFTVDGHELGEVVALSEPKSVQVRAEARGRNDFHGLELIHNGQVIHTIPSAATGNHFRAALDLSLRLDQPGWLALRIPLEAGKNELGRPLFAHTSPIYVELNGRRIFQPEVARELIAEIERDWQTIVKQATFASSAERKEVEAVYQTGIAELRRQLQEQLPNASRDE